MAISDFDFSSPGVQFREVDESTSPEATPEAGITIIGTAPAGPGMVPTRVTSIEQFRRVFGNPNNGQDTSSDSDVFRNGNTLLPNYGMYAAKAWLAPEGASPVTFIRLLGQDANSSDQTSEYTSAGWNNGGANLTVSVPMNNGAFGLFLCPSGAIGQKITGSLAAVIYCTASMVTLRGYPAGQFGGGAQNTVTSSAGQLIKSLTGHTGDTFQLEFWSDDATVIDKKTINFDPNHEGFIRNNLNTNPQKVYSNNFAITEKYFLGETYEESVKRYVTSVSASSGYGIILPLELKSGGATTNFMNRLNEAAAPKTGWIITRDPNPTTNQGDYDVSDMKKLFRVHSLHEGEWMHGYHIRIADLKFGNTVNPNCSFSIEVKKGDLTVEKFANLNLDPSSLNYVARRIGTSYQEWDQTYKVFDDTGRYRSRSNFIRIEEAADLKNNAIADSYKIPWGFWGPMRPKGFSLIEGSAGPNAFGDNENAGVQATVELICTGNDWTGANVNDKTLTIELPDGTTHTITVTAAGASSATNMDNGDFANDVEAAAELKQVLDLAAANGVEGSLQGITVSAVQAEGGSSDNTRITLTAPNPGTAANGWAIGGSLVTNNNIKVNPASNNPGNSHGTLAFTGGTDTDDVTNVYVKGNASMPQNANFLSPNQFAWLPTQWSGSFKFPRFKLTEQSTRNGSNYEETMDFGVRQAFSTDSEKNADGVQKRKDYLDLARRQVYDLHGSPGTNLEPSFIFSMDDVVSDHGQRDSTGIARWYWQSGSHATAYGSVYTSYTAQSGSSKLTKNGPTSFNIPLFGGSDGLDITQVDPFSNWNVLDGKAKNSHYAYYSVHKALDMVRDEEKLRAEIISMPGLTETNLIKEVVNIAEARGDTLAIIDYNDGSKESYENSGTRTKGSVATVISTSEDTLQIDSNKAAVYWPKVELTTGGFSFMAPASVAAIGALAFNDAESAPWFAPAGFNRGGLSVLGGTQSNLAVTSTDKNLTKKNRDDLYSEHINPIAKFPAANNNVVIFGQKTLYKSEPTSALTRVNVRRLMIFLRQRISDIADTVLFEQNVSNTFNNFSNRCQTVLENVKSNFGITEYSIQRIEKEDVSGTGVEEDLQDRNILYVRIFVKPARAIEFIAIDFVISRSDAQI